MGVRPARILLSAVLTASLLLLNFTVVAYKETTSGLPLPAEDGSDSRPATLALLLREDDMQDPETTACRYAIRQVIRMGEPLPALLALAGTLPTGRPAFGSARGVSLSGAGVPRNAERIAAFLHDLAAAL